MASPNEQAGAIYDYLRRIGVPGFPGTPGQTSPINMLELLRSFAPGRSNPMAEPGSPNVDAPDQRLDPRLPQPPPEPPAVPPGASIAGGSGRGSPVVTPGTGSPTSNAQDLPTPPVSPNQEPQDARQPNDRSMDRLANFGFAMAASRNPSLFGQIGEAGLAMQRGDRENRQDTRQEREIDVMQEYRQAQISLAEAEQAVAADPNSPINVARLMTARAHMLSAQRAGGGGGGGSGGGSFVPLENPETGGMTFFNPRTGATVAAPEGFGRPGNASREDRLYQQDVALFGNMNRQNPRYMTDPQALVTDAETWANARRASRERPAGGAGGHANLPAAPTDVAAPPVIPWRRPGT